MSGTISSSCSCSCVDWVPSSLQLEKLHFVADLKQTFETIDELEFPLIGRRCLLTNDDGIESRFLWAVAEALATAGADVRVAAPRFEQSWIGRAFSRHRDVKVSRKAESEIPAWSIDGTPSDCVNIAIGNLLGDWFPELLVSGINIGFNCTMPMLMSSGTFAGAVEGAHWGVRSLAVSQAMPRNAFVAATEQRDLLEGDLASHADVGADHVRRLAATVFQADFSSGAVWNVNFPWLLNGSSIWSKTTPAPGVASSFFEEAGDSSFRFRFQRDDRLPPAGSDLEAIAAGRVSVSVLRVDAFAPVDGKGFRESLGDSG